MKETEEIKQALINFRNERDWEQFHDSKNLALAISIEASELNELFLWKKGDEVENVNKDRLKEELADILSFAFLLAEKHNLNVFDIVLDKIKINAQKYPADKAKGTAKAASDLAGKRIATSYPTILNNWLTKQNLSAEVVTLDERSL